MDKTNRPSITYTLSDWHGNPPQQAGGVCVAAPGQTIKELAEELRIMYKERLISMQFKQ